MSTIVALATMSVQLELTVNLRLVPWEFAALLVLLALLAETLASISPPVIATAVSVGNPVLESNLVFLGNVSVPVVRYLMPVTMCVDVKLELVVLGIRNGVIRVQNVLMRQLLVFVPLLIITVPTQYTFLLLYSSSSSSHFNYSSSQLYYSSSQ